MDYAAYLPFAAMAALGLIIFLLVLLLINQGRILRQGKQLPRQLQEHMHAETDQLWEDFSASLDNVVEHLQSVITTAQQSHASLLESGQRQQFQQARSQQEALHHALTRLDSQLEQLRQSVQQGLQTIRESNDRQLTEMRRTVDEKLTQSLDKRLNDSFAQVSHRLEQVYRGLGEMQSLASGVGDLKKVLTGVKTRGNWGEMQLAALMRQLLAPGQYEENVAVVPHSAERVEFAVKLPGRSGENTYLPIDSKFPQEDYLRLTEASQQMDKEAVEAARKALTQRIKTEAKRISSKYIAPPHTTDFAVMFLPVEGLYAEVVQSAGLTEQLQAEYRVVVAGPSTFSALLNALQMGFRTLAIEQRSGEVWKLLGAVKSDFGKFSETLDQTRRRLQQASESIDTAFTRTRSIQKRLGAVETLGMDEGDGDE
ncbi:MAG: DNA recombination protein RmuC [Clostridia bacterium]|nr:DNA recombination protein RmuC [Clostridia bacterium]